MALLLDRWSAGQSPGLVSEDLATAIAAIEARQKHALEAGSFDIAAARSWLAEYSALIDADSQDYPLEVGDRRFATSAGPVGARVYTPSSVRSVIVFVHGGGWVIGSLDSHDHICRWLASASESAIVSVDYSLAPEHPFPTAVNQVAGVLSAVLGEERRSVFIAGDSAGANIAAMAVLSCSESERQRVAGFVSIYGAYSPHLDLSSHKLYGDGRFGLSEAQMRWFWNLYAPQVPDEQRDKLTPLGADLTVFPPTLCIGAECDLLLDDTIAFYSNLTRAGIDVSLSLWPAINHGAMHFVDIVDSVTQAADSIIRYIGERRGHDVGAPLPPASATLARVLQTPQAPPLSATVIVDSAARSREPGGVSFTPIESAFLTSRLRLHGTVAHRLALEIVGGGHAEGALLPKEEDASAAYGVSRSAYREAIRTLAAKGLVSATPKVGTRVASRSASRRISSITKSGTKSPNGPRYPSFVGVGTSMT